MYMVQLYEEDFTNWQICWAIGKNSSNCLMLIAHRQLGFFFKFTPVSVFLVHLLLLLLKEENDIL